MTNERSRRCSPFPFKNFISLVLEKNYAAIEPLLKCKDFDINMEDFRGVTALHYAAELDDSELIKMILDQHPRAKINAKTLEIMSTPLMIAAGNGKTRALEVLLENHADTSCQNSSGYTALMLAAEGEYEECVEMILKKGNNNIKLQNYYGMNVLMLSVNNVEIAKKLIKDSDLSQVDAEGSSVLHLVSKKGSFEVLQLLLKEPDIAVNYKNFNDETPLHLAIQEQHLDFAKLLIQNGASLLVRDSKGYTPFQYAAIYDETEEFLETYQCEELEINDTLILAAQYGRLKTLKKFIPTIGNEAIGSSLIASALGGHLDCLKLLMDQNNFEPSFFVLIEACLAALSENRFNCFRYIYDLIMNKSDYLSHKDQIISAAFSHGCFKACKLFLEMGVDQNGNDPETYLMVASGNGHIEVVKLLLDYKADVNRKHENMGSALLLATINNHLDIVKILIEHDANVSISDESGFTPLICAAYYGYSEIFFEISKLCNSSKDRTNDGLSALLASCLSGKLSIVEWLIDNGAKTDEIDNLGNNCFHCAAEGAKNIDVLVYLVQKINPIKDLLLSPNAAGKTPLDLLISHQNQSLIFSILAAKPEIGELIEAPNNFIIECTDNHDMCLICRDDFILGDVAIKLLCRHLFHENCYTEWAVTKANCPYCQRFPFRVKNK